MLYDYRVSMGQVEAKRKGSHHDIDSPRYSTSPIVPLTIMDMFMNMFVNVLMYICIPVIRLRAIVLGGFSRWRSRRASMRVFRSQPIIVACVIVRVIMFIRIRPVVLLIATQAQAQLETHIQPETRP